MPRTPAKFRQADITRAIKAVEQSGADMRVRLAPDGSIIIEKSDAPLGAGNKTLAPRPDYAF